MFKKTTCRIIWLMLCVLTHESLAMEEESIKYYPLHQFKPIVFFPSLEKIKEVLNRRYSRLSGQLSTQRWIKEGKYKFFIQYEIGPNVFDDFPRDFPRGRSITKVFMLKSPKLGFKVLPKLKKEMVPDYEYFWHGENYWMIAPFLCWFNDQSFRRYTLKIQNRLNRHRPPKKLGAILAGENLELSDFYLVPSFNFKDAAIDKTQDLDVTDFYLLSNDDDNVLLSKGAKENSQPYIISNVIQLKESLNPSDVCIVSSHPEIDGNFVFTESQQEIQGILRKNGAEIKPAKEVWCLKENKWVPGGLVVIYYDQSSIGGKFTNEWYVLSPSRKEWIEFTNLDHPNNYRQLFVHGQKLSAHINDLYILLDKKGFKKEGQILPLNNRDALINRMKDFLPTLLKELEEGLSYLEKYEANIRVNGLEFFADIEPLLERGFQHLNNAFISCHNEESNLKDYLEEDAQIFLKSLTFLEDIVAVIKDVESKRPFKLEETQFVNEKLLDDYLYTLRKRSLDFRYTFAQLVAFVRQR